MVWQSMGSKVAENRGVKLPVAVGIPCLCNDKLVALMASCIRFLYYEDRYSSLR